MMIALQTVAAVALFAVLLLLPDLRRRRRTGRATRAGSDSSGEWRRGLGASMPEHQPWRGDDWPPARGPLRWSAAGGELHLEGMFVPLSECRR
jgi:hypothetical protein